MDKAIVSSIALGRASKNPKSNRYSQKGVRNLCVTERRGQRKGDLGSMTSLCPIRWILCLPNRLLCSLMSITDTKFSPSFGPEAPICGSISGANQCSRPVRSLLGGMEAACSLVLKPVSGFPKSTLRSMSSRRRVFVKCSCYLRSTGRDKNITILSATHGTPFSPTGESSRASSASRSARSRNFSMDLFLRLMRSGRKRKLVHAVSSAKAVEVTKYEQCKLLIGFSERATIHPGDAFFRSCSRWRFSNQARRRTVSLLDKSHESRSCAISRLFDIDLLHCLRVMVVTNLCQSFELPQT